MREEYGVTLLAVREQWTLARTGFPSKLAPPKTRHGVRKIPVHASLEPYLRAWVEQGWRAHVGRDPKPDDFLFPDETGHAFREDSCAGFLADVKQAGCDTTHKGVQLEIYSLRHSFATAARRAGVLGDTRDRVLGHGPRDTKSRHHEDEDLPVDAREIAKMPPLEDAAATAVAPPPEPTETAGRTADADQTAGEPEALVTALVTPTWTPAWTLTEFSNLAEEERFELPEGLHPRRFSKPLPSTTRPLLQIF